MEPGKKFNIFNKPLIGNFARLKKKSASEREAFLEEKEIKSPDYRNILKLGSLNLDFSQLN